MSDIREQLDAVLRRRQACLPVVDEQIRLWRRIHELVMELGDAAEALLGTAEQSPGPSASFDPAAMAQAAQECVDLLTTVRGRVSRDTVNIGVSGRARNGKSTVLQSLSGLTDRQIPTGRGQPVTAVRSRIYHSATDLGARLTMHTETSFLTSVIAPFHLELGLQPVPRSLAEFVHHTYPPAVETAGAAQHPEHTPMLARVREAQEALDTYRHYLTGETRSVDLVDIRDWVAYPDSGPGPVKRPYLAVRDAAITCPFPVEDVSALGLVDMPGLGELVPEAETHHLDGLRNDVDFVILVKRPTDTNAMWAKEDAAALKLIGSVCTSADVRDFALILVNTGECLPENVKALDDDLRERLNGQDARRGYWVILADGADREAVRDLVLRPVLEHLAAALPRMDAAVVEDAVARCRSHTEDITRELDAWSRALRAVAAPTTTEHTIARAERLREEVAASVQAWVDTLRVRAEDDFEDAEFLERVSQAHQEVRDWVLDGFGTGARAWQERALNRMRVDRAALPHASTELNRIRVEIARRYSAVDDLLTRRRDEYWAGLIDALGPRLARLVPGGDHGADRCGPQEFLSTLATALRDAPDACPVLAETLGFALDVRLDYRTRMLPRVRQALVVLHPEPDDPAHDTAPTSLLTVPRSPEGAELLLERITQLARQAAYDAQTVLAQEPATAARALFAYAEQFEDSFVRSESSEAEFRRLVEGFQDRMWPEDRTGPGAATAHMRRVRGLVAEITRLLGEAARSHATLRGDAR